MTKHITSAYHLHVSRVIFASLCLIAIGIVHLPVHALLPVAETKKDAPAVLAYATSINRSDLVTYTNNARAANGMGSLNENSKLNVAAQLKANDMIANNYWAHVSPSGVQPWYWFTAAGYDYTNAGENLAYGFSTSDATVTAWMNSAGHRANILGSFQDVGHGIANGENYQGNQNTVVVAHYGTERAAAPAPAPTPTPAAPTAPTASTPSAPPAPTAAQPAAPSTPTTPVTSESPAAPAAMPANQSDNNESTQNKQAGTPAASTAKQSAVTAPPQSSGVPTWQLLLSGQAPLLVIVSLSILAVAGGGYMATHVSLMRRAAHMGEQYVMHHPVIDATFLVAATAILLLTTVARIG